MFYVIFFMIKDWSIIFYTTFVKCHFKMKLERTHYFRFVFERKNTMLCFCIIPTIFYFCNFYISTFSLFITLPLLFPFLFSSRCTLFIFVFFRFFMRIFIYFIQILFAVNIIAQNCQINFERSNSRVNYVTREFRVIHVYRYAMTISAGEWSCN